MSRGAAVFGVDAVVGARLVVDGEASGLPLAIADTGAEWIHLPSALAPGLRAASRIVVELTTAGGRVVTWDTDFAVSGRTMRYGSPDIVATASASLDAIVAEATAIALVYAEDGSNPEDQRSDFQLFLRRRLTSLLRSDAYTVAEAVRDAVLHVDGGLLGLSSGVASLRTSFETTTGRLRLHVMMTDGSKASVVIREGTNGDD